jgi:hypothetical protein
MSSLLGPDPAQAALKLVLAVVVVAMGIGLWFQLMHRVRRFGGGRAAGAVEAAAVVGLLTSLVPSLVPFDVGLFVLIGSLAAIYRPEQVVKATRGPRVEWRALREGRELQVLVQERGGPALAARNPEITDRIEALDAVAAPTTARYVGLLRETLLADPAAPGVAGKLEDLAAADAELRALLQDRPSWEKDLEARARGEAPAE